jgi:chromate transporter
LLLRLIWDFRIFHIFESFYRYGYLVIGGGQVVVPLMYSELVEVNQYMTNQEFLTVFGLVQGLPGPMFSFSAYAGGLITIAAVILMQNSGFVIDNFIVMLVTVALLFTKKVPAPLIVVLAIAAGFVF